MKNKEGPSIENEHEEDKVNLEDSKVIILETQVKITHFLHMSKYHLNLKQSLKYQCMMVEVKYETLNI